MNADGSDPIVLALESDSSTPQWSPDGTAVVTTVPANGPGVEILVASIGTGSTLRFPATVTEAQTELSDGDVSWQRLAP